MAANCVDRRCRFTLSIPLMKRLISVLPFLLLVANALAAPSPTANSSSGAEDAAAASSPAHVPPAAVLVAPAALVPQRKTEQLAVLSLIFSVLGLFGFCCGLFLAGGVAGIVCGHIALSRIKANPELEGHGLALTGVIIGYLAVAGWLIWILLFGGLAVLQGISESMTKH